MTRAIEHEPAQILSARHYRETSLLLEVFTVNHGRVGLVARGARGSKAKLRGVLQLFRPLLLSWYETGELGALTGAEADGPPIALPGERVFHGWYLNELVLKLTQRQEPHEALYRHYARALAQLAGEDAEAALRRFEKQLLAELGYALPLDAPISPNARYRFDLEAGAQPAEGDTTAISGVSLIALRDERFDTRESLRDARRILRAAIARQLAGRPLETPRLLRAMRLQAETTKPSAH